MGTMKVKVPVNPESSGFYIWGMAQRALDNIKKSQKTLINHKQCALHQIRIEVQGQPEQSMSQKDIIDEKYKTMDQLATQDMKSK